MRAFREGPVVFGPSICAVAICLGVGGCGFSIPIKPLGNDDIVTGSISSQSATVAGIPLGSGLTEEDWRRARSAMSVALDPLGNGERTAWDNPETGHSGAFRSAGLPFARAGEVCRSWAAEVRIKDALRHQEGEACRAPGDEWRIAPNLRVAANAR